MIGFMLSIMYLTSDVYCSDTNAHREKTQNNKNCRCKNKQKSSKHREKEIANVQEYEQARTTQTTRTTRKITAMISYRTSSTVAKAATAPP